MCDNQDRHKYYKLPRKWLDVRWVELASSVLLSNGNVAYNSNAIDKSDLYLWIRTHKFPQTTGRDFRKAVRRLCYEHGAGYKPSALAPELRKLLNAKIQAIGKRMWSCQLAESKGVSTGAPPAFAAKFAQELGDSNTRVPRLSCIAPKQESSSGCTDGRQGSQDSKDGIPSTTSSMRDLQRTSIEDVESIDSQSSIAGSSEYGSIRDSGSEALSSGRHTNSAIQHEVQEYTKWLGASFVNVQEHYKRSRHDHHKATGATQGNDGHTPASAKRSACNVMFDDEALHDGMIAFGFGLSDVVTQAPGQTPGTPGETWDTILPNNMSDEHLAEFDSMVALLRYHEANNVAPKDFKALEQHFVQCFSLPSIMSVVIMNTDRFQTGRADPCANQQACELFGVELTQVQHIIMGIESTKSVVKALKQAAREHASTGHVSGIWINTRDQHGNPCPRLVDIWLPRVVFNGTNFVVVIAPHGTTTLERAFEPFVPASQALLVSV